MYISKSYKIYEELFGKLEVPRVDGNAIFKEIYDSEFDAIKDIEYAAHDNTDLIGTKFIVLPVYSMVWE